MRPDAKASSRAPTEIGDAEPGVERIQPDLDPILFPVWLVAHRDVHRARRLRVVWEALAKGLR